jgi:lipid-A-disaccharide synthase
VVNEPGRTIFFSAADVSADAHTARVISRLRQDVENVRCVGLGGEAMAKAGCKLLENLTNRSAMLTHAVSQVGFYYKLRRRVREYFRQEPPDVVVVVDSPAWNFHVAQAAKELGIPVLYYIAPQLWAWGAWRVRKLRERADKVACILPFEEEWFRERGIDATYVGHPLFDDERKIEPAERSEEKMEDFPTIALLAGSRSHEIKQLWQPMQQIALRIKAKYRQANFITAVNNDKNAARLRRRTISGLEVDIRPASIEAVARHADLALVASGTATLEVAAQHCPMIIMYHVPWLQWHLAGRYIVKTKYLSLVNILAGEELAPEYMPFSNRVAEVAETALGLLADDKRRQRMRIALGELVEPIMQPGAAQKVAQMIKKMLPQY